ncbi:hypothetical protein [Anaerofustis butyriciformans]|uniref:hypothetical protein n=1 Tax=Anaerofustis butyriciformans TaxID=3108533 RepID=UPI002E2F60D6|nr:hypothetical protein [Anaerofustis sp. HA2171]
MKKKGILYSLAMYTPIFLILVVILFLNFYDNSVQGDLSRKFDEYINAEDNSAKDYKMVLEIMYSKPTYGIKYVNKKIDYEIVEKKEETEKKVEYTIIGADEYENTYYKVKIKVTSYNYADAYKNAVMATNKYIEQNKNISKEEIQKYFGKRLEYEGRKIIDNKDKTVMYVYKKQDDIRYSSSRGSQFMDKIMELPGQKDNLDFLNAMLGGLVEEMDRTKLPKGVDLEETLQLMGVE